MSNIFTYNMGVNNGEFLTNKQVNNLKKPVAKNQLVKWQKTGILPLAIIFATSLTLSAANADGNQTSNYQAAGLFSNTSVSDRWSGFYFGASIGGGLGKSRTFYDRAGDDHPTVETSNPNGYLGSISMGYNQQLGNNIVVGIEGDLGVMNLSAPDRLDMWDGHIWKSKFGGVWGSLRPRVGYSFDNIMVYGTAGVAFMQTNEIILGDNDATQNTYNQNIHTGYVFGGGVEYALSDNLSTKIEYLQMQFPEHQSYTNNEELYGFTNSASIVRVGLNYKF